MATFLERLRGDPARVRLDRLERLQALTEELSAAQTRDEVLRVVLERGLALVEASTAALFWERTPGELELVHGLGLSDALAQEWKRVAADDAVPVAEAYRTGRPLWVAGASELQERFPAMADPVVRGRDQAWAALPLASGGGRGAVALSFSERRAFDEEERNFILAAARQCSTAAERARLFDATNRLAERLRQLLAVATAVSGAATPRDVAAGAFRALGTLGACAVELHARERDRVVLLARHGRGSAVQGAPVGLDAPTPAAEVVRTGRAVWLEAPEDIAERYPHLERDRAAREERTWAAVPLLASGQPIGALVATFAESRRLEADDRTYLRLVSQPCAQALDRARLFQDALRAGAEADATTALLSEAIASAPLGFALLDREMRFLRVNEEFARGVGISAVAHVGRSPVDVFLGDSREPLLAAFHEALATGRPADRELEVEVPASPGARFRFATTFFPVRIHGEIAGVGLVIRSRS